jgi:hypothetical protein
MANNGEVTPGKNGITPVYKCSDGMKSINGVSCVQQDIPELYASTVFRQRFARQRRLLIKIKN